MSLSVVVKTGIKVGRSFPTMTSFYTNEEEQEKRSAAIFVTRVSVMSRATFRFGLVLKLLYYDLASSSDEQCRRTF
eukprot:scaffold1453_cov195-Amphora_coffeaeformis.AAC.4